VEGQCPASSKPHDIHEPKGHTVDSVTKLTSALLHLNPPIEAMLSEPIYLITAQLHRAIPKGTKRQVMSPVIFACFSDSHNGGSGSFIDNKSNSYLHFAFISYPASIPL